MSPSAVVSEVSLPTNWDMKRWLLLVSAAIFGL